MDSERLDDIVEENEESSNCKGGGIGLDGHR